MDGCADYMKHGLQVPDCVKQATADYERSQDRIGRFLDECCTECPSDEGALRGNIYAAYSTWCHSSDNRFSPVGSVTFYAEMAGRGYHPKKVNGSWMLMGIKPKSADPGKIKLT